VLDLGKINILNVLDFWWFANKGHFALK